MDFGVPKELATSFFTVDEYQQFSRGLISGEDFYKALVDNHLKTNLIYDDIVMAHNEHIYEIDNQVVNIIKGLDSEIAILTDTNEWQTNREKELISLTKYSNNIFRFHETHMLKTDVDCFPYIVNKFGEIASNHGWIPVKGLDYVQNILNKKTARSLQCTFVLPP